MFEGLKKKFSSFVDSLTKKEEEKIKEEQKQELIPSPVEERVEAKPQEEPAQVSQVEEKLHHAEKTIEEPEKQVEIREEPKRFEARRHEEPKSRPKVSLGTRLKGVVFRDVKISENDVEPFLEQLKIALIQSDVNYEVVEKILDNIHNELVTNPISSKDISGGIVNVIRQSILEILNKGSEVNIIALANSKRERNEAPFRILFLGPNGAGKTTAMAKIANMLIKNNLTCIMSASDTFRAAAVEQTVYHAGKLGIGVVKGKYGADPASVAFDAIAHAKAHKIDVVLIDSAGRQETNKSLMEEIKKMVRIAQPDLKIFVGEGIVGNALLNQVREFDSAVKLDGIILTKLDADAKGGNTLSILGETNVPVLFFGIGEGYNDLMAYDPAFVIDNIMPANN